MWNGNEVWLIASGGAMVVAFPHLYASAFSGFYLAFMLQAFLLLLLFGDLLDLLLVDQTGLEQLVAKGKAHEYSLTYATAQPQLGRFFS